MLEIAKNIIAIIVAIEDYNQKDISKVFYAINDAEAVKDLLLNHFNVPASNIIEWTGSSALKSTLDEELPYHIRNLGPDDTFIFYYAGHGFHNSGGNRFTTYDTHKNNLIGTTVSMQEKLLDPLANSACKNSIILLDACAANISEGLEARDMISDMTPKEFEVFGKTDNFHATFCSCSPGQKSYPSKTLRHGVWTWHLLEALKGKEKKAIVKDAYITDTSLQNYLRTAIPYFIASQTTITGEQTPYAKIAASNTTIIRTLPIVTKTVATTPMPQVKLLFEDAFFQNEKHIDAHKLKGFFRRGTPYWSNPAGNKMVQEGAATEIDEELQAVYDGAKSALGLRRSQIIRKDITGGGSISTSVFDFKLSVTQHPHKPGTAIFKRVIHIKTSRDQLNDQFSTIFPVNPNTVVIPAGGQLDFDKLVEQFEDRAEAEGGQLTENQNTGIITYETPNGITLTLDTAEGILFVEPYLPTNILNLIDTVATQFRQMLGHDIKLLPE